MPIFLKEAAQYDWAKLSLNRYIEEYESDPDWVLRTSIRKDTINRARAGLSTKKIVYMRKPKVFELTIRQVNDALACINNRNPYHLTSYNAIYAINSFIGEFNSGAIALLMYGPSDKSYETGKGEQNVKRMIYRMRDENLLVVHKRKFYKLPVWTYFYIEVRKIYKDGKFVGGRDVL